MHDLRRHAQAAPDRTAIICGTLRMSYGELEALANRLAGVLRAQGLQRGDHVAALMGNRAEVLALGWAAWRTGLYLTPMSTALSTVELQHIVHDCNARVVVVDVALASLASSVQWPEGTTLFALGGRIPGFTDLRPLLDAASPAPFAHEPPGALMLYTSGTTGAPKGVIRPLPAPDYRGTPTFAGDLLALFDLAGDDVRYLSTAPLYHAAPLRFALAVTAGGGTVHVMERFDAASALDLIEREGITHSQWVPDMFRRLLSLSDARRRVFRAPAHRAAIHGAAPCPAAIKQAMIRWWGPILLEYYSGTEGVGLTLIDSHEAVQRPGSVGRPRKGTLHIVDESGAELPAGTEGLVCFSGVAPFAYYKAPEKTAGRTLPGGRQTFGDIGHVDADGYLYLTDRQDDMIISGGVNVYPQEIEAALLELDGVWDCAVVGVADERFGERPVAFVVPDRTHGTDAAALRSALARHSAKRLGRIKQPDEFHLIDELPRSATGKLLRRSLRDLVNEPQGKLN
ncbi:AMP-binding protein [Variovorax paradoxus]|nr:AMP-binding protein [Variovorax paradoxus]